MLIGRLKRFIMTLVFIAVLILVFILVGGGDLLDSAGKWLRGMGDKAEDVKDDIEDTAEDVREKTVEKLKKRDK